MMRKVHFLVLCHNNYWTTHSCNEYQNCLIKLAFFSENVFKEVSPVMQGSSQFLASTETPNSRETEDPKSEENPENPPEPVPHPDVVMSSDTSVPNEPVTHTDSLDQNEENDQVIIEQHIIENNKEKPIYQTHRTKRI